MYQKLAQYSPYSRIKFSCIFFLFIFQNLCEKIIDDETALKTRITNNIERNTQEILKLSEVSEEDCKVMSDKIRNKDFKNTLTGAKLTNLLFSCRVLEWSQKMLWTV